MSERPKNCQKAMMAAGGAYPRSCPLCSLGPCKYPMVAQDRPPPSVDQTSLDPVAEAVERLSTYAAGGVCGPIAEQRVDLRTLIAAYAEMKEGLAVSQESGSRPGQDGWRLIGHFQQTPWQGYMEVIPEAIGQDGVLALYASSENEAACEGSRAELESLRSKLDLAVKALEPLKALADLADAIPLKDSYVLASWPHAGAMRFTIGDCRLARSTLTEMRKT